MKLYNNLYTTASDFQNFISERNILDNEHVLIQLLLSGVDENKIKSIVADIQQSLPKVSILGTTTAGVIADGQILDNKTNISISVFEKAMTKTVCYKNKTAAEITTDLKNKINDTTKLAIVFANTLTFNATELLEYFSKDYPQLTIVGGNSGDDFLFKRCIVFTEQSFDEDVVIALIDSEALQVETKYHMNWEKIGSEIEVTKSLGSKVYELNGEPALDIYRRYLGNEVASNPLEYAMEFPLLFSDIDIDIARAPVAFDEESGALTYAGDIPQGTKVKFGFANIQHIEQENQKELMQTYNYYNEAIYIYSCAARRQILGDFLNEEIEYLNNIAPSSGFITYGEFFHDQINCNNAFLNITTTYVVLNETPSTSKLSLSNKNMEKDKNEIRLKALTNFVTQTGKELDENIHYLSQFKEAVDNATILSTTDKKGYITSINQNFIDMSGYDEDELIGTYHSIIKHPDTPMSLYKDMWKTITKGVMWKGLVKNKKKDGSSYYVLADISPIYNKDGSFREYLSIRTDITELEEYKMLLQNKLNITNQTLKEKIHYTSQYENAVDSSIAVIKTDTNNIITYANKKANELSGYSNDEIIGMSCTNLIHKKHTTSKDCESVTKQLAQKKRVHRILTNIDKNGNEYTVSNIFFPIENIKGEVIEHLQLMHDITEIVELTQEILDTQKEVVFTMGAIGETRSNETGLHVKRVAEYSYLLARLYGLSEKEAELLKQASPMHDIGKVGIPDSILNKPGKLTFEEFEVMKTHAELGYEMLKHSKREILKTSATVAYEHHEKWNGKGYPRGLKGEDIHIYGRITAVADVFDALGHDRVYKKAWDMHKILELFKEERGKHFDPELIDLFMNNLDKFLEIRYTFK